MSVTPPQRLSEDQLLADLSLSGLTGRRAFNSLYQQYNHLIAYARHTYNLTLEEAEEAYHEALLGLVRVAQKGQGRLTCKIKTLLHTILSHRSIDALRRRSPQLVALDPQLSLPSSVRVDPFRQLADREEWQDCQRQLELLGENLREVLLESAKGYSSAEIASRYGYKNAATVDVLKHRARKALKAIV